MINIKKIVCALLLFACLALMPLSVSAQSFPGWDVGPGWDFLNYYVITSTDSFSTVSPNGTIAVSAGSSLTINYAALTGYGISAVLVDGVPIGASSPTGSYTFSLIYSNHTISVTTFPIPTVTPTPTQVPVPTSPASTPTPVPNIHNHPTQTLNLYMRSDTYNHSSLIGYGLDADYTNNHATIPISVAEDNSNITYGFRVYVAASASSFQELTAGVPDGLITINGNQSIQTRSSGWNCPDTSVVLGVQVLKIDLYAKVNDGAWTIQATYISNVLMTKELMPATWTFSLNLQMSSTSGNSTCIYSFGDTTYRSTVSGIVIVDPNYTDIQTWQWGQGDIIGLIFGSYLHVCGPIFYVLIYIMIFGGLYFRHRNVGPVIFAVLLLGGGSGVGCWVLLPPMYATIFSVLIIVALAALLFKVIR